MSIFSSIKVYKTPVIVPTENSNILTVCKEVNGKLVPIKHITVLDYVRIVRKIEADMESLINNN